MMPSRHSIAWFILLMGASATIFFFIRNEDTLALNTLFLTLYITVTILYFMRIFYYLDNRSTLNEIYFFSFANIIPLAVLAAGLIFPLGSQNPFVTFNIEVQPPGNESIL